MEISIRPTTPIGSVRFDADLNNQQLSLCNNINADLDSKISMAWQFHKFRTDPNKSIFEIPFGSRWRDPTEYEANVLKAHHNVVTGKTDWEYEEENLTFKSAAGVAMVLAPTGIFAPIIAGACEIANVSKTPAEIAIAVSTCAIIAIGTAIASAIGSVRNFNAAQLERDNSRTYLCWREHHLKNAFLERDEILSNFLCPLTGTLPDIPAYIYGEGHNDYFTVDFLRSVEFIQNNVGQLFPHTNLTCSASRADRRDPAKNYISVNNLYLDYAFLHSFARRVNVLRCCLINKLETDADDRDSVAELIDVVSQKLFEKAEIYNESEQRRHALGLPSPRQSVDRVIVFPTKCIGSRTPENAVTKFFRKTFTNAPEKTHVTLSIIPSAENLKCLTARDLDENGAFRFFNEFPNVDPTPLFHR